MLVLLLLIFAFSTTATPTVVDQFGTAKTTFAPGDVIYIYFPEPGTAHVKIIDTATGAVVLDKTINVKTPGPVLLWSLPPNTAEGVYRVYVIFNDQPYVYPITIATPTPWQLYLLAATAAIASLYVLWHRRPTLRRTTPSTYRLQLPNNYVVEINTPHMVFGRDFFLKLGIPQEVAKYISRSHFAIYAQGGKYYIQDTGSKNGTWLNGRPIKGLNPQPLRHGDVITVAQVLSLRFLAAK